MDIYNARKLYKYLFKESIAEYKFTKVNIVNGKLCYFVGHKICDNTPIEMTINDAMRICFCIKEGIHYLIDVMTEERLRRATVPIRSPAGVYIIEYIEIE